MNCISALVSRRGSKALIMVVLALAVVAVLSAGESAHAFEDGDAAADSGKAAPPPEEHVSEGRDPEANLPYLFAVFLITWAGFFGYVFVMSRRQREMQREIEALRLALDAGEDRERESQKEATAPGLTSRGKG